MLYLVLCSCIWAFSYGLIKGNLTSLSPDLVAFARMVVPFLLFLPFLRRAPIKETFSLLGIGAVQYGLMYLFCIRAYSFLPAHQVVLFTALTPLYVTLLHDLFTGIFRPLYLVCALLAFLGAGLLYRNCLAETSSLQGFLLVQLADLCFAFGQVAYKRLRQKSPSGTDKGRQGFLFLGGTLVTLASTCSFHGFSLPSFKQTLILLYLGAIASGLCFFWWNRAALAVQSGTLAVCNNLKMPLGVLVSLFFFQEKAEIAPLLLSCLLILLAIFLVERKGILTTPLRPSTRGKDP